MKQDDSSNSTTERHREVGPIERFLTEDHERLDALLRAAAEAPGGADPEQYGKFRAGLLRHIAMEEKILLPAAAQARGGEPLPIAERLRLDHGALASLLVPSPSAAIVDAIRSILARHNRIEEGPDGLYATCDRLLGARAAPVVEQLRAAPDVPVSPHNDGPKVMGAVRRALERAGYHAEAERLTET